MGVFIYKLNDEKTREIQKSTVLQAQVNNLNKTIDELQEETTNSSELKNDDISSVKEFEISGTYYQTNAQGDEPNYTFLDSNRVNYGSLWTCNGTYTIDNNIIKINFINATDPDGNEADFKIFGVEESVELTIIDENSLIDNSNSFAYSKKATTNLENNTNQLITFDGSKSINSDKKDYRLSCQGNAGIWIAVDSTQKILTFNFTPTKVVEYYPLNWTSTNNYVSSSEINFEKKIVDVFFGGMGQDSSGDTLFILLEDGTVEYIPIVHMFNHVQAEVISYGKVDNVNNIIRFTLSETSGGVTTLAIKNDGTFYDLWNILKDSGNY